MPTSGPVGQRIGGTVRRLRHARGLDLRSLSDKLAAQGWPIKIGVLSNLERGERSVDVDDLVALALALDVSPARLLMPLQEPTEEDYLTVRLHGEPSPSWVQLTSTVGATWNHAWAWVTGERPLDSDGDAAWHRLNRPHTAKPIDRHALNQQAESIRQLIHQLQQTALDLEKAASHHDELHPIEALTDIKLRPAKENPRG